MFDELFEGPFFGDKDVKKLEEKIYRRRDKNLMKTDIREADTEYELEVNLPGFKKDGIKIPLKNGYLTICATKGLDKDEQEKNSGKYIRQERYTDAYERSFCVGRGVTDEDTKGKFKHGVLRLSVPKKNAKSLAEEKEYISIEG